MLKERVKTGAVLVLLVCLVLALSHIPWLLKIAVAGVSVQCFLELYRSTAKQHSRLVEVLGSLLAVLLVLIDIPCYTAVLSLTFIAALLLYSCLMGRISHYRKLPSGVLCFTIIMILLSLKSLVVMRGWTNGLSVLIVAILVSTVTDCAAYFVGRKWGVGPLAPKISPNKTREGSLGAVICTAVMLWIWAWCMNLSEDIHISYTMVFVYGICASCVGQFGDLAFSAIKRVAGVKDYGTLLPGHGGLLDRIDSILFVLPFTYLFCILTGQVI